MLDYPTTDSQLLRLPKHAQETISRLRRELDYANRRIEELELELAPVTNTESRVFYEAAMMESGRRVMPDGAYFHFILDHGEARVTMQRSRYNGKHFIDISADQSVVVRPTATNAIRIFTESRFDAS